MKGESMANPPVTKDRALELLIDQMLERCEAIGAEVAMVVYFEVNHGGRSIQLHRNRLVLRNLPGSAAAAASDGRGA